MISFEVQELHGSSIMNSPSALIKPLTTHCRNHAVASCMQVVSFGKIHGGKGSEELEKFCYTVHAKFPDTQVPNAAVPCRLQP